MHSQEEVLKEARGHFKAGRESSGLGLLREVIRRGQLDPEGIEKAGRALRSRWLASSAEADAPKPLKVLLVGQFTTSWLVPALTATAWGHGVRALVSEGGFDNVLQDLSTHPTGDDSPDIVVMLPWNRRLLAASASGEDRVESELVFWKQAWSLASSRLEARILQVGYDWVIPGALGHHMAARPDGPVGLVNTMNARLRAEMPPGAYFVDLDQVSGTMGRSTFYDMRRYYWTKQPFGEAGCVELSRHLWAGIRALTTGPKKVLVLDLDNTLWGGVVGETGPLGVALGESADGDAFRAFQAYAKELTTRGVILALASKNNLKDALEPFEKNREMVLTLDDIAAYEINWDPKGTTIGRLAKTLNLGLDSFVFFDDNPAEREQVRQAQPEVEVVDVPEDPAEYVRALQKGLWFETTGLTAEDAMRAAQYAVERQRRKLEQSATSMDDYLISLEMVADVGEIDEGDLQRVVQLLSKTNQFNLTTRRHTREDVLGLLARPRAIGMTVRVRDKFGDHGLIGVLIGVPTDNDALKVDTFLMSCRVIGRTVEQFCFRTLWEKAKGLGYRRIVGEYIPSAKNALVAELYDRLGIRRVAESPDKAVLYEADLVDGEPPATFVQISGGTK
jgi:FkbH-like protein